MEKLYFSCTLKSDIVLNASMATEGNMNTLNYIPGSNFWGIVASQLYPKLVEQKDHQTILDLFHNGSVRFGDAHISTKMELGYPMPFTLFKDKLANNILETDLFAHYVLDQQNIKPTNVDKNDPTFIQLKQHRTGLLTKSGKYLKGPKKKFALKSAHCRELRKSKDGAMFGFESLSANQTFIFSVSYKNKDYKNIIIENLVGSRRIGKSKSAQYGLVEIKDIPNPNIFSSENNESNLVLVYAASNLCLLDQYGHPTFQPDAKRDFGIDGKIIWSASQIRTYAYSPWNSFRNTTDPERHCILAGSVITIKKSNSETLDVDNLPSTVGQWTAQGLGEVLYNPSFLKAVDNETGKWLIKLKEVESTVKVSEVSLENSLKKADTPSIASYLQRKNILTQRHLKTGKAVQDFISDYEKVFQDISNSQWGFIRTTTLQLKYKTEISTEKDTENKEDKMVVSLQNTLFGTTNKDFIHKKKNNHGILIKGIAAQKYWDKNFGQRRTILWEAIEKNKTIALDFTAKLATEMTKESNKN